MTSKGLSKKQLKIRESLADIFDQCQKTLAVHKSSLSRIAKLHKQDPDFFQIEFKNIVNRVLIVSKREPAVERVVSFIIKSALKVASLNDEDEPDEDVSKDDSEDEEEEESEKSKKKKKKSPRKKKDRDYSSDDEENSEEDEPRRAKPKKKAKSSPKKKKPTKPTKEQEIKVDFAIELVRYLLDVSNAKDKGVRFRSCQMVAGLMQGFEEIDNALWDDVEDRMMTRIHDRFPSVRCQAVQALSRLQEPNTMNDKVTKAYLELLRTDTSKDVRKHVLQCIGLSKYTLDDILVKSRDRSEDVRKSCFAIICEKIEFEQLTVTQRAALLKDGLCDRDEGVKNSAIQMCDTWFTKMGEYPIKFLQGLKIEENEEVAEIAIRALLANRENITIDIQMDAINSESALFWRLYCEHLKQVKNEEALESCLPNIEDFCKVIEFYKNDDYVIRQLFLLAKLIDYAAHEMGRRELSALLRRMLPNRETSMQLSNVIMQLLQKLHPDESDLIQQITEIISEILDPIETENRWEKETAPQWIQCLTITEDLLEHVRRSFHHPGISGLLESVILPAIQDPNIDVRNKGIRCLGLFCLLNVEDAKKHLYLFLQIVKNDRDMIKVTALRVLFDFIMAFGIKPFEEENNFEEILSQDYSQLSQPSIPIDDTSRPAQDCALITTLDRFLDASNSQLRSTVVEGFAKIMTCNYYESVTVLTKLFLAFFDPSTEKLVSLRQCLTIFFSTYASFPKHKGLIAKAFRPTIRTILSASKRSSLRDVQISDVVNIMLSLISQGQSDLSQISVYYESLAQEIIDEILEDPEGQETKQLCKALTLLVFSKTTSTETLKSLKHYSKLIASNLKDKNAVRSLEKFANTLNSLDTVPDKVCEKAKEIERRVAVAFGKEEKKKEEEPVEEEEEEEEHDDGYIPVSPPIVDASGASVAMATPAESTPQKKVVESTPKKNEKKSEYMKQQSDYFNEIDNYKVPGISTKKRKSSLRKSSDGVKKKVSIDEGPKEWIEEKTKLVSERDKMMQEIEMLKKQLAEKESPTKKQKTTQEPSSTPLKRAGTIDLSKPPTKTKTSEKPTKVPEKPPTTTAPASKSKPTTTTSKKQSTLTVSDSETEEVAKDSSEEDISGAEDNVSKNAVSKTTKRKNKREEEEKKKKEEKEKEKEKKTVKGKEKGKKSEPKKKKGKTKDMEDEPEDKSEEEKEKEEEEEEEDSHKKKKSKTQDTSSPPSKSSKRKPTEDPKKKQSPKKDKPSIPEITTLLPSMSPKPTTKYSKSKSPKSTVKRIMVSFSGFKASDTKYNDSFRDDLQDRVLLLQGAIADHETFDSKITHVILPPNTRTMKTLAASLTKRWLVSEKWILDSTEAGFFIDETPYGFKRDTCPFEGKKVFISGDFLLANREKNIKEQNFKLLIEQLGKGKIVSKPNDADYVLVANVANESYESGQQLNWAQFFDLIQPPFEMVQNK